MSDRLALEIPEDFNPQEYLRLNPDVMSAGVDPREHYLNFGLKEGRKYSERLTIALGLIAKDESPYICEWIAHHMSLGIDKFFIADNSSTDGTKQILANLNREGLINLIHFPGKSDRPPQLMAYDEILRNSQEVDWIGFIDTDEFICPTSGIELRQTITELSKNSAIGAIAINWSIYGSSFQTGKEPGLVIERFTHRAEQIFEVNKHYKSFLRLSAVLKSGQNPHHFILSPGKNYVHVNGRLMSESKKSGHGLSEDVIWSPFKLNHYVLKSKEEFSLRAKKTRATTLAKNHKNDFYFRNHDRNEVVEKFPIHWVDDVKNKENILYVIDAKYKLKNKNNGPISLQSGFIDSIQLEDQIIRIRGWGGSISGSYDEIFSCCLLAHNLEIISIRPIKRPDVNAKLHNVDLFCGFEITCSRGDLGYYDLEALKDIRIKIKKGDSIETLALNKRIKDCKLTLTFPKLLKEFYINQVLSSKFIVEYGSGSSTFFCAVNKIPIVSVESDLNYLKYLKKEINSYTPQNLSKNLLHADLGITKELDYPINEGPHRSFPQYALLPWTNLMPQDPVPDLVLIDGRFRVACMLATMVNITKPTKVLFDDYIGRNYGEIIEKYIQPQKFIDRAAYFVVNPGLLVAKDVLNNIDTFYDPR